MSTLTTTLMNRWLRPRMYSKFPDATRADFKVGTGRIPDMPDRVILITKAGSGQTIMNGLFEENVWRFFCRGASNSLESAEELALALEKELDGIENYDMWGPDPEDEETLIDYDLRVVSMCSRGRPRQLTITDSQSRFQFVVEIEVVSSID